MSALPEIRNAFLFCKDDVISDFGTMEEMNPEYRNAEISVDAFGRLVFPGYCDPHTHLVYAESRESEFVDRIRGLSYLEIAERGGGILNSARRLHEIPEDELFEKASVRINEIMNSGTVAVEIKSGYGLTTEDELKMLRVIRRIGESFPLTVVATFMGAHAIPERFRNNRSDYIDLIINEMIPEVSREKLADYIDVFCDKGFFTPEETGKILEAGISHGMRPKIHANELDYSGGTQVGVRYKALSVDHLEYTGDEEIAILMGSSVIPTLLPGASFFLGIGYAPARKMIDAGLPLALASDYNPGSSPSGNMNFIFSLACIKLRMTTEEALNAITLNSAFAMGLNRTHGSISRGKTASFIITRPVPGISFLPYSFGSSQIESVFIKGKRVL